MSIDGLHAILDKEEIVATQRAGDLFDRPDIVDRAYQHHVRTYVPFSRQSAGGEGQSVTKFERQVIREVKQAGSIPGYITAEYGHGKTSTALYLWQKAREANLLVVPPFQLNKLADLIRATYGWVRYEIERTRPQVEALKEADIMYHSLIDRGAKSLMHKYGMTSVAAQRMAQERPDILELSPADYIGFFEQMTHTAQQAGFDGLLILADELQQYIDPEVKSGIKDPISPLFDVISAILTRRNYLNFGLIMVIPPKELGQLRDTRGDFIHRLLRVSLDLRTVYDQQFPERLWLNLAKESKFEEHQHRIISQECLVALGQVGARGDLSDGPRTVINTFRRATKLYLDAGTPYDDPYTPESLVNDLLQGQIQYDSSKRIAQVTSRALAHSLVKDHPVRERAIKWAATFPNEGIPREWQVRYGLDAAFDELAQSALGDLIISVGDVKSGGMTLCGLEEAPVETDWLSLTTREFRRGYEETAAITQQRAMTGFLSLLKTKVFPENQWKVVKEISGRLTQNTGLILTGSFTRSQQRFPERTIHVRILWEDEQVKDTQSEGDALIEIRLRRYFDRTESERQAYAEPLQIDYDGRRIHMTLNLLSRSEQLSPQLEQAISSIVSPYKRTPLLLLNLYQVIDEQRIKNAIPKADKAQMEHMFQPDLLDNTFRELFNGTVGTPVQAAQERITELALHDLFESIYPTYSPLIIVNGWNSSLQKYRNALGNLETTHERQGQIVVEGTKQQIADLFVLSNTGLDSFARNFSDLIEGVNSLNPKDEKPVRFTLHPLEKAIMQWLHESNKKETVQSADKSQEIHMLPSHDVYERALSLGYLDKELDAVLELMEKRGLVDQDTRRGFLREAITQAPSIDELENEIDEWLHDITILRAVFTTDKQLRQWQETAEKAKIYINEHLRKKPNDTELIRRKRGIQQLRQQLILHAQKEHHQLRRTVSAEITQLPILEPRIKKQLENSVQGVVEYALQVNDLRSRMYKQFIKLESDINQVHQRIQSIKTSLQTETLDYLTLVKLAKEANYSPISNKLRERRDSFQTEFNQYVEWVDLVGKGSDLINEIQQWGDLVQEENQTFEQLSRDIRGRLSAEKTAALPYAPNYKIRLLEIIESVRGLKVEATSRFTSLQDRYRNALTKQLGFPSNQLWEPHQYNPVAPQTAYDRLKEDVQRVLQQKVCQGLANTIDDKQKTIRATLQSSLLLTLPPAEQANMRTQGQTLAEEFSNLTIRLNLDIQRANDLAIISDFPDEGEGAFNELLYSLGQIRDTVIAQLHPKVEGLSSILRGFKLTAEEDMALAAFPNQTESMELAGLRQQSQRLSEDGFWEALRGLHDKRRINIQITPVHYD